MRREVEVKSTVEGWVPRTSLGKLVQEGKITSMEDVFTQGHRIVEAEIVDILLPGLEHEVLATSLVQKQTDAGEKSRFKAIVVVGVKGYIGVGSAKAKQWRMAVEKAVVNAKLRVTPVRYGCGSWECACGQPHSLPFKVIGKCGSVMVEMVPGPRGLGIVASENVKTVIRMAGIKDCWTRTRGSTRTTPSLIYAVYNALRNTYRVITPEDWVR